MNNSGTTDDKTSDFIIVVLGFIILWFGFICFAAMNIVSMLATTDSTYTSQFGAPTVLNITLFEGQPEEASTQLMDVVRPLETPVLDINLYSANLAAGDTISSLLISRKVDDIVILKSNNEDVDDMIFGNTVTVPSER